MVDVSSLPALLQAEDWAGAERLLRRAAKDRRAPAQVFYNLGKVLEAGGKAPQSGAWYRRAVAVEPGYANAWFELGRWAVAAEDLVLAEQAFARAARLAPQDLDAWRNLGRVRLRRGQWAQARTAWLHLGDDAEARVALYRVTAELGEDTGAARAALLSDPALRPQAMKALTRVAKGAVPLRFPKL
ncbi:MAG: hypothetical protein CL814_14310 [Confluentimicrobium sp.]|uniref:tetratricopeptide repeat protein n=1 Tax=Actibacterium sp. TaxID=1872125 RepID=UPI000C62BFB2|nr:tetratricopeptide repeat protein [Actibacterium sp.]MBC58090.1 hypothetical protein [Actibacterium sp.]